MVVQYIKTKKRFHKRHCRGIGCVEGRAAGEEFQGWSLHAGRGNPVPLDIA